MEIDELIGKIDEITENIYGKNIYNEIANITTYIDFFYEKFIKIIPQLNSIGLNIEIEILLGQINSLANAIEDKDEVLLFDTLKYEIKDTLSYYKEIDEIIREK